MPSLPPGLGEWLPLGLQAGVLGWLGVLWYAVKKQEKPIDELRADMKELRAEHRADNRVLGEKLDRLVESLLAAKQP